MTFGVILFALGALLTLSNVYLSFLHYPIHLVRGGTRDTYRWVSGIPLFGSLLLWISIGLLPSTGLQWVAGILSIFDTGGIHWLIGTLWWTGELGKFFRGQKDDDPFGGRRPTSHERLSGQPWDASYRDGPAPWDIGGPQPAIVRLVSGGKIITPVLDVGCGTGENALHVASLGLPVLGVDVAETALAIARRKASEHHGMEVEFAAADAFQLDRLGRMFETVLDCGLFHTFDSTERPAYVASLASVTAHGGTLYVLCFSDEGPDTGPHPIRQEDLRAVFNPSTGWNVAAIDRDRIHTRFHNDGAPAWFATIKRT